MSTEMNKQTHKYPGLRFSCYSEHLWVRPMCQCLTVVIMVKPNMYNVQRKQKKKMNKEMVEM